MPLARYGVLRGTLTGHHRDNPDSQGAWYHVNLDVQATGRNVHVAVDVDSKSSTVGVQWKTLTVKAADLGPAATTPEGFTDLASTPVGARNWVVAGQAACRYSWTSPSHRALTVTGSPAWNAVLGVCDGGC